MAGSGYGKQPALSIMRKQRWTVAAAAREIGVDRLHLSNSLHGHIRPNFTVREKLPELLGEELADLFTRDAIRKPYQYKVMGKRTSHAHCDHGKSQHERSLCRRRRIQNGEMPL